MMETMAIQVFNQLFTFRLNTEASKALLLMWINADPCAACCYRLKMNLKSCSNESRARHFKLCHTKPNYAPLITRFSMAKASSTICGPSILRSRISLEFQINH